MQFSELMAPHARETMSRSFPYLKKLPAASLQHTDAADSKTVCARSGVASACDRKREHSHRAKLTVYTFPDN